MCGWRGEEGMVGTLGVGGSKGGVTLGFEEVLGSLLGYNIVPTK